MPDTVKSSRQCAQLIVCSNSKNILSWVSQHIYILINLSRTPTHKPEFISLSGSPCVTALFPNIQKPSSAVFDPAILNFRQRCWRLSRCWWSRRWPWPWLSRAQKVLEIRNAFTFSTWSSTKSWEFLNMSKWSKIFTIKTG